ncbi:hypothetical protein [Methylocella tundrae]|uniref:hypothetical protein n=1 Tax=Methylocella tundrae TaxID=227605 RepID=UPI0030FE2030|nr:hypothetical protein SIN04_15270 [Methylocella tundrae]
MTNSIYRVDRDHPSLHRSENSAQDEKVCLAAGNDARDGGRAFGYCDYSPRGRFSMIAAAVMQKSRT